jgi:hypothetical protein
MSKFMLFESNYISEASMGRPAVRARRRLGGARFVVLVGAWFALAFAAGVLILAHGVTA